MDNRSNAMPERKDGKKSQKSGGKKRKGDNVPVETNPKQKTISSFYSVNGKTFSKSKFFFIKSNEEFIEINNIVYLVPKNIATSNTTVTATTVTKSTVSTPSNDPPEVVNSLVTKTTEAVHEQMDIAEGIFFSLILIQPMKPVVQISESL